MNFLYVEAFESYRLIDRQTDINTQPKLYKLTTPLRGWSQMDPDESDAEDVHLVMCLKRINGDDSK